MSALDVESLPVGLLTEVEQIMWAAIKPKLGPVLWDWYAKNKDDKGPEIFHLFTPTVGSLGLVAFAFTKAFGPAPTTDAAAAPVAPILPPPASVPVAPVALSPTGAASPVPAPVTTAAIVSVPVTPLTPGVSIPAVPVTPASPILTPIGPTIAQHLAGPPLRPPMPTPIGAPGLPGETAVYTYAGILASIGVTPGMLDHLPLGTPIRAMIEPNGPLDKTQVDTAFGNTGQTVPNANGVGFTVQPLDISDPFYSTDITAYDWPSVLNAKTQ